MREQDIMITPDLNAIRDRRRVGPDGNELPPDAYVFGNEAGEIVARRRLNTWWNDTLTAAGVETCTFTISGANTRRSSPRQARLSLTSAISSDTRTTR